MQNEQVSLMHIPRDEPVTELLNDWAINQSLESANKLRSLVFIHLKGMIQTQLQVRKHKQLTNDKPFDILPSATTLLQDVIAKLAPSSEVYQCREEFLVEFATFIRWVLLDDIKRKQAQKRTPDEMNFTALLTNDVTSEKYVLFDQAFSSLQKLRPRSYQVALLHYFLGYSVSDICGHINRKKSTVNAELSVAKAYIYSQIYA